MPTRIGRLFWFVGLLVTVVLSPANADVRGDYQAALEDASARCRLALRILETESQQDTAAAVLSLRQSWERVVERQSAARAAPTAEDTTVFLDVDMRIIGVLLVIDLGNRDAARSALEAIENILAELSSHASSPD